MGAARLQPAGLGPLRQFGRSLEMRTAGTVVARPALAPIWLITRRSVGAAGTGTTLAITAWAGTIAPWAAVGIATRATVSVASRTIATVVSITLGQLLSNSFEWLVGSDHLEQPSFFCLGLVGPDRQNGDAIHLVLGIRLQDRANLGIVGQQTPVQYTFGFTGAGGSPGPRPVGARTCELNINPTGHRCPR